MNKTPQIIENISTNDDWAYSPYEECEDGILRALAKAWRHAAHIPQNLQQYRASILQPAIEARIAELHHPSDIAERLAKYLEDQWIECHYDGVCEGIDIGVAIRASAKKFLQMNK